MGVDEQDIFEGYCILELMGHRRLAGYVREQTVGGASFLRLDVPGPAEGSEPVATQFYSPAAVYCITPTTEAIARRLAQASRPEPVQRWELPPAPKDRNRCGASVDYEIEVEDDPDDGGRD
jgi:hypothetical protein